MVFVFVHLQEIIMYIVGQVISKIAITGHHPRIISDDVARHLERGGTIGSLVRRAGDFFPHFFVLLTFDHCKYFPTGTLPYMSFQ